MLHSMKYLSGSHAARGISSRIAALLEQSSQHQQEVYTVSSRRFWIEDWIDLSVAVCSGKIPEDS